MVPIMGAASIGMASNLTSRAPEFAYAPMRTIHAPMHPCTHAPMHPCACVPVHVCAYNNAPLNSPHPSSVGSSAVTLVRIDPEDVAVPVLDVAVPSLGGGGGAAASTKANKGNDKAKDQERREGPHHHHHRHIGVKLGAMEALVRIEEALQGGCYSK